MPNGGNYDRKAKVKSRYSYDHIMKRAAVLLRQAYQFKTVADLACKVPLIVGAIVVLLIINTALQYAAGPALQKAFPAQDSSSRSGLQHGTAGHPQHIPLGLKSDVVPGGADAELLCVDKISGCDKQRCSDESVLQQDCKSTCGSCEGLRSSIQSETGLQVRIVQQLSGCVDLHPACSSWQQEGRCSKEHKAMLELCQASCGFCQPPVASPLATLTSSSSSSDSSRSSAAVLLDACQDDVSVCPYLAITGLCSSSSSTWVKTQCARSCGHCSSSSGSNGSNIQPKKAGSTDASAASKLSSSHDSSSNDEDSSSGSSVDVVAAGSVGVPAAVVGVSSPSSVVLRGHTSPEAPLTSINMEEWNIPGCKDHQPRCPSWSVAGECSRNIDYMMVACKASCNNCKALQTATPLMAVQLSSGWLMPSVGFGTAGLGVGTAAAVEYAAAAGYRMFDSAESKDWYDESAVGVGLTASKVPRDKLFLTSKIHPRDLGSNQTLAAFNRALGHLHTTYLDLLLLHYPACFPGANCIPDPSQSWQQSWRVLEALVGQGKVRSIGVSNFGLSELQELLSVARVHPSVLESRSDPFAINHQLIQFALTHNMTFIGYSTLGTQWINSPVSINPVFNSTLLQAVAARHPGKSVAQVVLRWALQLGQVVIPRSSNTDHIPLNRQLFDFSLSDAEMQAINGLDGTWKTGGLPLPVA